MLERSIAEKILQAAVELDGPLGALDAVISRLPDEGERRAFAKELGDIIGRVNDAFIRPIVRLYPDLDPDAPRG